MNRKRIFLILSATLAFCIALGGFLFWFLGGEGDAVKKSATQFAAAVEKYDPGAAPEGGGDYVEGIRAYYGPVAGARFVDSYKKNDNGGPNTGDDRSYWVAQVLLRTERGAAVVEVEYDNNGLDPSNQDLQRIYELRPGDLPDSLGAGDRAEVERAFASRGGQAADSIKLSGAFAHLPKPGSTVDPAPDVEDTPVPPANDEFARQQREAMKQLRCVRKAKGDVEKLRECVP